MLIFQPPRGTTSPIMGSNDRDGPALRKEGRVAWILLSVAGIFEVVWAYYMKLSEGFSRPLYTVLTFAFMFVSFWMLSVAMKTLPLGTAYAVWTGIGAVGAFLVGLVVLGESATPLRILAAVLIVSGIALMKFSSTE